MSETVEVSESSCTVAKSEICIGETIPTEIEKFLATLFDLKTRTSSSLKENCSIQSACAKHSFFVYIKCLKIVLKLKKILKSWSL